MHVYATTQKPYTHAPSYVPARAHAHTHADTHLHKHARAPMDIAHAHRERISRRIDLDMGDISLEQFLAHFKTLNLEVSMISCGVSILYR